ncbi:MAG: hypothetical protein ACRDJN_09780, partial [Chloroflexota bacterium]
GQLIPDAPAAAAAVPSSRGGRQALDMEARLRDALGLIGAYPPTAGWPAFLARYGVSIRVGTVAGGLASYRADDRTLTVDPRYVDADPRAVAALLVHETLHAIYDATGRTGNDGKACIDEEAQAFAVQSAFWAYHHGLDGSPAATAATAEVEAVEQELNRLLSAALDDALVGTVITTWAYTLRCYFPDLGTGAPEE